MYNAPQFYSVLWICLFDIEYSILKTFIYRTSTMAYLFWYIYIRNTYNCLIMSSFFSILFYSNFLYVCILLECCTYCIYWTLWSVTSSYCKWKLMFYCFTVPTWNKVFLLLLLLTLTLTICEFLYGPWSHRHCYKCSGAQKRQQYVSGNPN